MLRNLILTGALGLLLTIPAHAQSKLATINLKKVFDNYWKTKQADALLKERAAGFDKQRQEFIDSYKKANEDYKKLLDGANDPAVTAEEKEKRKKMAEAKLREIQEIETNVNQFDRTARSTLDEDQRRKRDTLLREIQEVISVEAKTAGYAMVWDTAAESFVRTPILVYTNGENDMSDKVLGILNTNAPAEFLKPAEERPASVGLRELPGAAPEKKDDKK